MTAFRPTGTPTLRAMARETLGRLGLEVVRRPGGPEPGVHPPLPPDLDAETVATVEAVRGYTLTPPERVAVLCQAVRYAVAAGLPGAFVECGVWRGGSSLAVVRTLLGLGVDDRDIYMFDTFEAMPAPGPQDVDLLGVAASEYHAMLERGDDYDHETYDFLPFESVQALLTGTGYPAARLHFVKGLVEDTVPGAAPDQIALLRLDTDYYSSTRHELVELYPRIAAGGVLLVDDYGHFRGCQQAVDEYLGELAARGQHLLLTRVDYSARVAVVPAGR